MKWHFEVKLSRVKVGSLSPECFLVWSWSVSQSQDIEFARAYRLSLWSIGGLAVGVFIAIVGIIVRVSTGSAALFVIAFALIALFVVLGWCSLFMLNRWALSRRRSEGIAVYDSLMKAKRQMTIDFRKLRHRS